MSWLRRIATIWQQFRRGEDAVVMTEAIIVVPFLTLFAVGILEFGAILWHREQMVTGLRDSVRYMSRCRHATATCESIARNIAYHGTNSTSGALRVPGWDTANSPITFTITSLASQDAVSATTTHTVIHSPLFGFLGINSVSVTLDHQQRDIEW